MRWRLVVARLRPRILGQGAGALVEGDCDTSLFRNRLTSQFPYFQMKSGKHWMSSIFAKNSCSDFHVYKVAPLLYKDEHDTPFASRSIQFIQDARRAEDQTQTPRAWKLFGLLQSFLLHRVGARRPAFHHEFARRFDFFGAGNWEALIAERISAIHSQRNR